jgi:peptidoglycan/xylan/chitin deacetylase (PgdA/CDA1 family)
MQSLLILLGILPFSLAIPTNTYTNITIPPFIPALPDPPYNKTTHIPFGTVLNHCSVPGSIALTFDDGPYIYTPQVLDALAYHGARATFFLNGRNRGHITQFPELVRRAHEEGHQLGSHT